MDMAASPQLPAAPLNGDSNGVNGAGLNGTALAAMDPARVVDHLAHLLEAALGATREELEAPGSLLSKSRYSDTLQRCTRFTNDGQVCLYIQKDVLAAPQLENGDGESSRSMPRRPSPRICEAFLLTMTAQPRPSTRTRSHQICPRPPPH